jgi:hypothetical protein
VTVGIIVGGICLLAYVFNSDSTKALAEAQLPLNKGFVAAQEVTTKTIGTTAELNVLAGAAMGNVADSMGQQSNIGTTVLTAITTRADTLEQNHEATLKVIGVVNTTTMQAFEQIVQTFWTSNVPTLQRAAQGLKQIINKDVIS